MKLRQLAGNSRCSRAHTVKALVMPLVVKECRSLRRLSDATICRAEVSRSLPTKPGIRTTSVDLGDAQNSSLYTAVRSSAWEQVPTKVKLSLAACAAFTISNMDKVNISIAIIPMAQEFGWTTSVAGLVQSSFFFGFLLMQLPGGFLSSKLGGRRVLPIGLLTWSAATMLVPFMASTVPSLCLGRAMVGLGEAVAPTSIVDIIARTVKSEERASAVSFAFTGLHFGSIVGLLASSALINQFGWRALFWVFGATGLIWYTWFEWLMVRIAEDDPETALKLQPTQQANNSEGSTSGTAPQQETSIPFRAFLRSSAVQGLCVTHFCNNWFHFTCLAWLPTYFTDVLGLEDLTHTATTSLFPPLAGVACSLAGRPSADRLVKLGWSVSSVRKLMQSVAFLGPAACLTVATGELGPLDAAQDTALVTAALGLSSFSLGGLFCTHQDMSPKYAGALLGLTNVTGALSGIVGVSAVGLLFDATHSWNDSLFWPNIALLLIGTVCFTVFCRNEPIDFEAADNSPFWGEEILDGPKALAAFVSARVSAVMQPSQPTTAPMAVPPPMVAGSATEVVQALLAAGTGPSGTQQQQKKKNQGQQRLSPLLVSYFTMASVMDDYPSENSSGDDDDWAEALREADLVIAEARSALQPGPSSEGTSEAEH